MVSLKQLQKQIEAEKKMVRQEQDRQNKLIEKSKLQSELFKLKRRKQFQAAGKVGRFLKKGGEGIISAGKKAAPVIKKQAKLIREQQLRDEAIERKLAKRKPKRTKKTTQKQKGFGILQPLDF